MLWKKKLEPLRARRITKENGAWVFAEMNLDVKNPTPNT